MNRAEHADIAALKFLAKTQLHDRDGNAEEDKRQKIRPQKHGAAMLEGEVRKPPDVAETNGCTHAGENEGPPSLPSLTFFSGLQLRGRLHERRHRFVRGDEEMNNCS